MRNVSAIDFAHLDQEDNFLGTMNPKTTDKKMMSLQFDVMTRDNHDVYLSIINQTKSNCGRGSEPILPEERWAFFNESRFNFYFIPPVACFPGPVIIAN